MKKEVLIIHESMNGGGAEKVLTVMLNHLDYAKYHVTLLLIYGGGVFMDSVPADVDIITLCEARHSLKWRVLLHQYSIRNSILKRRAKCKLGARKFDTTISFMEGPAARLHSDLLSLADKNISWVHTDIEGLRWYDRYFRAADEIEFYKKLDRIVFVSNGAMNAFNRIYKLNSNQSVIYNPIETENIIVKGSLDAINKSKFTIVNVGRLYIQKNQAKLIDVAHILKERGLEFMVWIVGEGALHEQLQAQINRLELNDYVSLIGFKDNPYPYIKNADLFCMTSDNEGFALVVAEALILGTPVVSTNITGPSELLSHGGGILTPSDSIEIANAIENLIVDKEALDKLKDETKYAASFFDLQTTMDQITALL
jgi:glycosyltransferase involved in cell wall biosynthesis